MMDPANTPAMQRNSTICHMDLLSPNRQVQTAMPERDIASIGFLPYLSAALPHAIMRHI